MSQSTRQCSHCQHRLPADQVEGLPPRCGICRDAIADGEAAVASAFGGLLICRGTDCRFADGERAEGVELLGPSRHYNFRVMAGCVEVPAGALPANGDLAWVAECGFARRRGLILVPLAAWDKWDRTTAVGATWPTAREAEILAKIESLRSKEIRHARA